MSITRRAFLRTGAAGIGAATAISPELARAAYRLGLGLNLSPNAQGLEKPDDALHLLNRISMGFSKADLEAVQNHNDGWQGYLDDQFDYSGILDLEVDQEIATYYPNSQLAPDLYFAYFNRERPKAKAQGEAVTFYRALLSKRHLFETMVEFWNDHFNMFIAKNRDTKLHRILDERRVLRGESMLPGVHALGNFRALMHQAWKGTCMLHYLDGHSNTKDRPNENYARELLELHTVGVDGGYTEEDIKQAARILTGWYVDKADTKFDPDEHDDGSDAEPGQEHKVVMGRVFYSQSGGRGQEEAAELIDFLVDQPATARFIATKLVKRFVSDDPPASLVDAVADTFSQTDGDIEAMLRVIFNSGLEGEPGFWTSQDQKIKRPYTFLLSCLKTLEATVYHRNYGRYWGLYLRDAGQGTYEWDTPDGYPEEAEFWLHPNDMRERWWISLYLAKGGESNIAVDPEALAEKDGEMPDTPRKVVNNLRERVLFRNLTPEDEHIFLEYASDGDVEAADTIFRNNTIRNQKIRGVLGLMLSSRYFQLR